MDCQAFTSRRHLAAPAAALGCLALLLLGGAPAVAQEAAAEPAAAASHPAHDPFFFGYGSEPGMEPGGRLVSSLDAAVCRAFGSIPHVDAHPGLAPAWELPVGYLFLLVQHEVVGHGGRAREFSLSPSYGINFDLSAYTSIGRDPKSNEQTALLSAAGAESDGVMAHRLLLDLLRPGGADAAKVPLALMAKLDLTLYVAETPRPKSGNDFTKRFDEGNDVAIYLVARQAERAGADPSDVWNRRYAIDFSEGQLDDDWQAARVAALWNLLDPSLVSAVYAYFRDHVLGGESQVRPLTLRLGDGYGLSAGTRAALGPRDVSRFLDLYLTAPWGVATVYLRDLDSSIDRTWGGGGGLHGLTLGPGVELSLQGDWWSEPRSREAVSTGTHWNASVELDALLGRRWGLSAQVGYKTEGFLPGRPTDQGAYFAAGVLLGW